MSGGLALIPVARASDLEAEAKRRSEEQQQQPVIQGLAAHVQKRWASAKDGKRELEDRMLMCLRQRAGEYEPDKLSDIQRQGGSEIYIMLTSVKCRAATSWLKDSLLGTGADKPWAIDPTPIPDLPDDVVAQLQQQIMAEVQALAAQGMAPSPEQVQDAAAQMRDRAMRMLKEEATTRVERMERKMEDQLAEGGFARALNEFIDDVVTFPFAALKGPVKRKRKVLKWVNGGLAPQEEIRNEWERVDPFMLYWAPWASTIQDGFVIERHKLTRDALEALMGVEGYSDDAIRSVLADFDVGRLTEWLSVDTARASTEGKNTLETTATTDLVDALQLWDSIQGKLLIEWGVPETEIEDPLLSYPCEVWLVGNTVIKAVLNYDPLGRKPYYVTSYEKIPGSVAGRGVPDLCRDSQNMVNASARSLANNMGISSGPQVGVNISRLPAGESITQMYPWKIWQFKNADYNDGAKPIDFFQPTSNAQELMAVFEKFSARADEDTMIPRYMSGEHVPGAGRTSSGLSMLISNAGKGIKQVISNIDQDVLVQLVERHYQDNLRYSQDPDLIGDVQIVAKGAMSLVVKEAEAVRRNEFLQIVLNSPVAQNIVGMSGAAELLRDAAKNLNGNVDRIVPDRQQLSVMEQQQQVIAQLQQQLTQLVAGAGQGGGQATPAAPDSQNILPDGSQTGGRESNFMSARPNGA